MPSDAVEAAIENHYRTINLSLPDQERVQAAIEQLAKLATTSQHEIDRCQGALAALKAQERKLLDKHYADKISDELFDDEAERIKGERQDAEAIIARLSIRHEDLVGGLALALKLVSADLSGLYLRANPTIRRLMNQAIFEFIWVWDEAHVQSQLASPFKELAALSQITAADATAGEALLPELTAGTTNDQASKDLVVGSISDEMVGETGFEPATARPPAGCATRLRHSPWCIESTNIAAGPQMCRPSKLRTHVRVQ